ncbi:hypothetical protein FNV43_RR08699 [Rhamnella rubrinervis]|uniref:Uncharacterized protein n=1 Tax=Rhamnella rubrinervis TaxID=2594499 RepID=A0A8K0H8P2_9ROSA|nr:hypothetical protein FNV43_RR08699 [Rhamnella rubrinervis]
MSKSSRSSSCSKAYWAYSGSTRFCLKQKKNFNNNDDDVGDRGANSRELAQRPRRPSWRGRRSSFVLFLEASITTTSAMLEVTAASTYSAVFERRVEGFTGWREGEVNFDFSRCN